MQNLDKQTYIDLIRAEKIGGAERQLEIEWITSKNNTARAEIRFKSPAVIFHDDLSFIKDQETWQIVSNVTQVVPVWLVEKSGRCRLQTLTAIASADMEEKQR